MYKQLNQSRNKLLKNLKACKLFFGLVKYENVEITHI